MTYYEKDEIRSGLFMVKDCPVSIVVEKSPVRYGDSLAEINRRLELVREKLAIVQQVVATNQVRH